MINKDLINNKITFAQGQNVYAGTLLSIHRTHIVVENPRIFLSDDALESGRFATSVGPIAEPLPKIVSFNINTINYVDTLAKKVHEAYMSVIEPNDNPVDNEESGLDTITKKRVKLRRTTPKGNK